MAMKQNEQKQVVRIAKSLGGVRPARVQISATPPFY